MTKSYRGEADALDAEILGVIGRWSSPPADRGHWEYSDPEFAFDFNDLALRIFDHQVRFNEPYARYCKSLRITNSSKAQHWQEIPPVPAGAFKEAALSTFDPANAALTFETSGTTAGTGGVHYMESARLYDASLLAGFEYALLSGAPDRLRYCMLLPSPQENARSSLSYMMDRAAERFGETKAWYVHDGELRAEALVRDVREARKACVPLCIAGTAFAFVTILDHLTHHESPALPLPSGSAIMETGGFKGRTRVIDHAELYEQLAAAFSLPPHNIVGEYGMTELSSQYYDASFGETRRKCAPPWLRSYAVDENGERLPPGIVGALVHVDLANRSSCLAIQTEDLGAVFDDGALVLIGRERGAELRGCSLGAESLRAAVS